MRTKSVTLDSGAKGSQYRLRDSYANFEAFESYSNMYGIHTKLGYKTPATAWRSNPLMQSGTNPSDLKRVTLKIRKTKITSRNAPEFLADKNVILLMKQKLNRTQFKKADELHEAYMMERKNAIVKAQLRVKWINYIKSVL